MITAALLLVACCPLCADADVSELLAAPPADAFTSDFRQAGESLPQPQGPPVDARFLQSAGAPRGFPARPPPPPLSPLAGQPSGDLVPTRRVFFRLGDNPPLSDLDGLTARAASCRDSGSCPDPLQVTSFPNPNNFFTGFPTAAPSDAVPRVQSFANFPPPPEFSRSPVSSVSPLPLTGTFQNQAPSQTLMEARPNVSPATVSFRTSPQFSNNALPAQLTSRSDVPPLSFSNNAPPTQLVSRSDAPRLSFTNTLPPAQPIFRSDTSRVALPNSAPQTQMGSDVPRLSFPNNAPPARVVFRPNAPQGPISNGASPTQLFPRSEASRPSISNTAAPSQVGPSSGAFRFAPSTSASSSQLVSRPEAFSSPQRVSISNRALCTPENPCNFPAISNEISAGKETPANYQFSYAVQDAASASDFAHEESAQQEGIKGQYRVLLPDGRQQVVSYRADETGFRPEVSYQ
ncbi:mucin-1-like [Schistocerca piceifrons]|uniref:mucin-1-like n=1 Tax=Schistocerca piceifrons TaxID=274613 RepID=UPI001F5E426E|nr:mucin-1-like [Schistocerca piceifrons]